MENGNGPTYINGRKVATVIRQLKETEQVAALVGDALQRERHHLVVRVPEAVLARALGQHFDRRPRIRSQ